MNIRNITRATLSGLAAAVLAVLWSGTAGAAYIQVADSGHVVSYTYSQFLNGTGGLVIGQANGYGDDAGFFFVPDPEAVAVSTPPTLVLLGFALAAMGAFRRRGPA